MRLRYGLLKRTKIRSHARALNDWVFIPELGHLMHGSDFFILFHHLYILEYHYFQD